MSSIDDASGQSHVTVMMRWTSGDRQQEGGFFIESTINEKAARLQVREDNMPEMMQVNQSNFIKHAKTNSSKMKQEKKSYPAMVIEIDDA